MSRRAPITSTGAAPFMLSVPMANPFKVTFEYPPVMLRPVIRELAGPMMVRALPVENVALTDSLYAWPERQIVASAPRLPRPR